MHRNADREPRHFTFYSGGAPEKVIDEASGVLEEDIKAVMTQANVTREKAIDALKASDGDIVTAIMNLMC